MVLFLGKLERKSGKLFIILEKTPTSMITKIMSQPANSNEFPFFTIEMVNSFFSKLGQTRLKS